MSDSSGVDNSQRRDSEKDEIYYYVGDRRVRLFPNPKVYAVRLEPSTAQKENALSDQAKSLMANAQPLAFLPRDRLNVYSADSSLELIDTLRKEVSVAQAYPAFQRAPEGRGGAGDVVIVTQRLLVQFKPEIGAEKISSVLESKGLRILEPLPYASPNGFLLEAESRSDGLGALAAANALVEEGLVVFAEPDLIQSRHWRNMTTVPDMSTAEYLNQQWHLQATGVLDAWHDTRGSPDIRIAILDDGLDSSHPEFSGVVASGQSKVAAQFDFSTGSADASPKTYIDNHGTACAGIAASAGVKAAGVAPGCQLVVARTPDYLGISDEAAMFQWAADAGADVISCSWGPIDGIGTTDPLPTPTRLSIRYCLNNGRTGKGIPIFWAAGNGSESVDDDGYASNPDVMAIAACTADEAPAPYCDFGSAIFACAPSNGSFDQKAIFTTDRRGAAGYNIGSAIRGDAVGDYINSFGGTSAAAPLAAGIAALVLSANPSLTVTQVRDLLRDTADRIWETSSYDLDGHSDRLGYGRLNAAKAVEAARKHVNSAPKAPTILGPESWSRVDGPPRFHVDPRPHAFYVVEVAAQPDLFDYTNHSGERNSDNFYGSWSDNPMQSSPTYILPAAIWTRLRAAEKLWYRVGSSASAEGYIDYVVSTLDDQGDKAPFIQIKPGVGAPPSAPEAARRTISELITRQSPKIEGQQLIDGPLHWDRRLGPPLFRILLDAVAAGGAAAACAIEVTSDTKHFDSEVAHSGEERPEVGYFRSDWINRSDTTNQPQSRFYTFVLPQKAWQALIGSPRLYYRLLVQNEEAAVSPAYAMDLTGEAIVATEDADGPIRADEKLWRVPNIKRKNVKKQKGEKRQQPSSH